MSGGLSRLLQRLRQRYATRWRSGPARRYPRLAVERLEDRTAPAIYTVNSVGDQPDPTPNDGILDDTDPATAGNQYTLRGAIQTANSHANAGGPDEIKFNLTGMGPFTIKPASALTVIYDPVVIDGYSQPGAKENTRDIGFDGKLLIELDGTNTGGAIGNARGLNITTNDSTVKGLVINKFHTAIEVGDLEFAFGDNKIVGNFLGTDTAGTVAKENKLGIRINHSQDNTIGGGNPADRNIISGNTTSGIEISSMSGAPAIPITGTKVFGNYIGTDLTGTIAVPNKKAGVVILDADNNMIGNAFAANRNVISGNNTGAVIGPGAPGITVNGGYGNFIGHNYIGTMANGIQPLGNEGSGVELDNDRNTQISFNPVISANGKVGVEIHFGGGTNAQIREAFIGKDKDGDVLNNLRGNIFYPKGAARPLGLKISANNIGGGAGPSIDLGSAIDVVIDGNLIEQSQGDAIKLDGASLVQIINNTLTNNAGRGVYAVNATDVTVGGVGLGNTFTANDGTAVEVEGGSNYTLAGNTFTNNGARGIFIHSSASSLLIDDNLIEQSQGDAIKLDGASFVQITNNTLTNNAGRGIYAVNATDVTVGGTFEGASLGNTITANTGTGVEIEGGSSYTLAANTITNNTARGVSIHDSASAVTVGGLAQGEANTISGNGEDALVFGGGSGHFFLSNHIVGIVEVWAATSVAGLGEVTGSAYMSNAGAFTVLDTIEPFGFQLTGEFTQTAGGTTAVSGTATFGVTGGVDLAGGTLTIDQGTVVAGGGLTIGQGAVLRAGVVGSAVLVADVVNAGSLYVGGDGFIGTLAILADASLGIGGHYTQTATGTLFMELGGPGVNDMMSVAGTATLDGLLRVDLVDGYTPESPDSFTLLGYGSRSGQFADIDLPPLPPGRQFEAEYQANAFILWVLGDDPGMGE